MRRVVIFLSFFLAFAGSVLFVSAQSFTKLADFDGSNGYSPSGQLMQAADGNLYGPTANGGVDDIGVLYQVTPSGTLSVWHAFRNDNDLGEGSNPAGRLSQSPYGALFGTTPNLAGNNGSIFASWNGYLSTLYYFCSACGEDFGSKPLAGLVLGNDGNFYGTTSAGGSDACTGGCGTIYQLLGLSNGVNYLYNLKGNDGAHPSAELMQASDGYLYGTTVNGGNSNCQDGCGTLFKIGLNGQFTTVYTFCSQSNCADGANPYSALVQGSDGALYGTTSAGGNLGVNCALTGCGTIFKITLDGTLTTLYSFCADYFCPTGANPQAGLILATDGNFYGTTYGGGVSTLGTVFRITPQGRLSVLHNFTGDDGAYPTSAVLQASDHNFYGTTTQGGSGFGGTLFSLAVNFSATLTVSTDGNGTITSEDGKIQCGDVCSAKYEDGDVVTLTATPRQHYAFGSWTGCDSVEGNVCTVTIHNANSVSASFSIITHPLTVTKAGSGLVTSGDGYIYCGTSCSHRYSETTQVKLMAIPSQGYTFSSWQGCDTVEANICLVSILNATTVTATFTQANVTITSFTLDPSPVKGGNIVIATVTLGQTAPAGGVGIAVGSDTPGVVHPPLSIVIPGGSTWLSFAIRTSIVRATLVSNVTAYAGSAQASDVLTLTPSYSQAQMKPANSLGFVEGEQLNNAESDSSAVQSEPAASTAGDSQAGTNPPKSEGTAKPSQVRKRGFAKRRKPRSTGSPNLSSNRGRGPSPEAGGGSPRAGALPPPPADPADERKEYISNLMPAVGPSGEYNGSLRDLPQIPSRETPERELLNPIDQVHKSLPAAQPKAPLMAPTASMPQPFISFGAMSYNDNCTGGSCGWGHPPDTTGAVGLRYYIQAINKAFAIYKKTSNGGWEAAFTEDSLWAGQSNTSCTTSPQGDPIVLYDQTADRWILTYMAFEDNGSGPSYQCLAVSKSGDPVNGGWWFYPIQTDQSPVPANTLNDYPKLGIWNDGCLYMGANGYLGNSYNGQIILSISRDDLYNGRAARNTLSYLGGSANFGLFPATMLGNGDNLPSPSTPEYFVQQSATADAFNVRTLPAGSCISGGTMSAAVAVPHDTYNIVPQNIVPQPPPATSANYLDSLEDTLMQWVQYRKVGSTESLWVNHTTYVTNSNTSPQWAQIDVTGGRINSTLVQQQIFRPDGDLFRWMGSLAVDKLGDMALCYSTSNASAPNYPSVQCAGRLATDPASQLLQGETEYVAGNGSQTSYCGDGICHRWGDYSSTLADPLDDCTFWHTNMYYADGWRGQNGEYWTKVFAFRYPNCIPPPAILTVNKAGNGNVWSYDQYINCGDTCSHDYDLYAQVLLSANPDPGWNLSNWSGCDSTDSGYCQITLYGSTSVVPTFTRAIETLTISKYGNGSGTVTSDDGFINCGSTCSHDYLGGTVVHLTPSVSQGSRFDGWTGCDSVQNHVCTVTMIGVRSVIATFDVVSSQFKLSVQKYGTGLGSITSSDGYINCGPICSYTYDPNANVVLTGQPVRPGSVLTGWVGCDQVQGNTCTVRMLAVRNVTARFDFVTHMVTASRNGSGIIGSGDGHVYCGTACSYAYPDGTQVNLTAVPGAGYTLSSWSGCDSTQGNVCAIAVSSAKNVAATFTSSALKVNSLVLSPASVKGGNISMATVTLSQVAPQGGLGIGMSSDRPQTVQPPSLVIIPGGRTSFSFAVRTSPVRTKTVASVTATAYASHANAALTVNTGYVNSQPGNTGTSANSGVVLPAGQGSSSSGSADASDKQSDGSGRTTKQRKPANPSRPDSGASRKYATEQLRWY